MDNKHVDQLSEVPLQELVTYDNTTYDNTVPELWSLPR
jgi:hypothetical protein